MAGDATTLRRKEFQALHADGCFVIPNPWDVGTARALRSFGFRALATTSAGYAFSRGLPDTPDALAVGAVLAHVAEIVAATDLPVSADFQAGYASTPAGVGANVARCVATGVAGLSIEDSTTRADGPLFPLGEAVERVAAAREAIDASGGGVVLTARAECFLVGHPDPLDESVRRLRAYRDAGADVLFAPGVLTRDELRTLVAAAEGTPVNAIVTGNHGLTVDELAELGVRRISVGSALARVAWSSFLDAARALAGEGSFRGLATAASFGELNALFG